MCAYQLKNINLQCLLKNKSPKKQITKSYALSNVPKRKLQSSNNLRERKKQKRDYVATEPNYEDRVHIGTFSVEIRDTTQKLEFNDGNTTYYMMITAGDQYYSRLAFYDKTYQYDTRIPREFSALCDGTPPSSENSMYVTTYDADTRIFYNKKPILDMVAPRSHLLKSYHPGVKMVNTP
jgi:hypothetical protein